MYLRTKIFWKKEDYKGSMFDDVESYINGMLEDKEPGWAYDEELYDTGFSVTIDEYNEKHCDFIVSFFTYEEETGNRIEGGDDQCHISTEEAIKHIKDYQDEEYKQYVEDLEL